MGVALGHLVFFAGAHVGRIPLHALHRGWNGETAEARGTEKCVHLHGFQSIGQEGRIIDGVAARECQSVDAFHLAVAGQRLEIGTHAEALVTNPFHVLDVDAGKGVVLQRAGVELDHGAGQVHCGEVAAAQAHHAYFLHALGQGDARQTRAVEKHVSTQPLHALGQVHAGERGALLEARVANLAQRVGYRHAGESRAAERAHTQAGDAGVQVHARKVLVTVEGHVANLGNLCGHVERGDVGGGTVAIIFPCLGSGSTQQSRLLLVGEHCEVAVFLVAVQESEVGIGRHYGEVAKLVACEGVGGDMLNGGRQAQGAHLGSLEGVVVDVNHALWQQDAPGA